MDYTMNNRVHNNQYESLAEKLERLLRSNLFLHYLSLGLELYLFYYALDLEDFS